MRSCALVVGINEYPAPSGMTRLYGAVADAADFADWALDPNGGNVEDRLWFWTFPPPAKPSERLGHHLAHPTLWAEPNTPDFSRAPDFADVVSTALRIAQTLPSGEPPTSRIYVFLAGHGVQTVSLDVQHDPQTCFITNDFRPGALTRGLVPCDDLRRGLMGEGFFWEVLMFLDCCRTRMNFNQSAPSLGWPVTAIQDGAFGIGRAAKRGAKAFEAPENHPRRGAFSQVLVDGLRRRRDESNQLTLNELENYVSVGVKNVLGPSKQFPQFEFERNPPYVLLSGPASQHRLPIVISFGMVQPGTVVHLIAADGSRVGDPIIATAEPISVEADTGVLYSLETSDRTSIVSFSHDGQGATRVHF